MKKLVFTLVVFVGSFGFMSCEQDNIEPSVEFELTETSDPGEAGSGDKDGGVKGS